MHVLICDDDPIFAENLEKSIIAYYSQKNIKINCKIYTSPVHLVRFEDLMIFQVAFLNVDMNPINGIHLGRKLQQINPKIVIIYISAFLEFAIKGYFVNAFRYILKQDLEQMLPICLEEIASLLTHKKDFLTVKYYADVQKIPYSEIYYLQSQLRKVNVYGQKQNVLLASFYAKISDLVTELEPNGFLQIGKSNLVNMRFAKKIASYQLTMDNDTILSVSRKNYAAIQQKFICWKEQL